MYVFDTNVFSAVGHYYPSRFPTIWAKIDGLTQDGGLRSVKEVRREVERYCPFPHVEEWVEANAHIFLSPAEEELKLVAEMFLKEQYRGLVKRQNILRGFPVADPFVIAAAKIQNRCVVTQESPKEGGARIPTVCKELGVECIGLEEFLTREGIKY